MHILKQALLVKVRHDATQLERRGWWRIQSQISCQVLLKASLLPLLALFCSHLRTPLEALLSKDFEQNWVVVWRLSCVPVSLGWSALNELFWGCILQE